MFKAKKPGIIVINDENLSFMSSDHNGDWQCIDSFAVSSFLDTDISIDISHRKYRDYDFSLMIVPDFWFGNRTYDFNSKDRAVTEAFIARKLKLEFPKNQKIQNLFTCKIIKNKEKQELVSLFLQEPKAGELCHSLDRYNIRPVRISSPALLWNKRLKTAVDSFEESGICLIHLLRNECYLIFYHLGNFIFSRTIPLPETGDDISSRYKSLSFELNQSAYHFSQRTKTQLDEVFLLSGADDNITHIRESIGRNIKFLDNKTSHILKDDLKDKLGLAADFTPDDLFPTKKVTGISDRIFKKELETRRIQLAGIIIGLALCLITGSEYLFLKNIEHRETPAFNTTTEDPKRIIVKYNEALDALLIDSERKKPLSMIGCLAASLPENLVIESIEVESNPANSIFLRGTIIARDIDEFSSSLRKMVDNLNNNFNVSNPMSIDDVEINMNGKQSESGQKNYIISFNMDLT